MKNDSPMTRNQKILLSIILVIAALSRFLFLDLQSFWYDELFTQWACHYDTFREFFKLTVVPDVHPPLYNTFIYFWAKLFGFSEIALRLPSAIFGFLAIYWVFKLGRMSFSSNVGILAAALTTVFWFPLYMAQEARSYSLVLFLSTAFTYYHYKLYRIDNNVINKRDAIVFVLSGSAMLYTHYYTGLFVILSAVFFIHVPRSKAQKILLLYICIGITYLPWVPYIMEHFSKRNEFWTGSFSPFALFSTFDFISINYRLFSIFPISIIALYLIMAFLRRGSVSSDTKPRNQRVSSITYFTLILIVPFVLIYLASTISKPLFSPRYYSFAYPSFVVLLSQALLGLSKKRILGYLLISVMITLSLLSLVFKENYYGIHKTDFRGAYQFMADRETERRWPVLVQGLEITKYPGALYAYFNIETNSGRDFFCFDGAPSRIDSVKNSLKLIGADTAWYLSDTRFEQNDVDSVVLSNFDVVSLTHFHWLELYQLALKHK